MINEQVTDLFELDSQANVVEKATKKVAINTIEYTDEEGVSHSFTVELIRKLLMLRECRDL
jgi:hypothetical protein